MKVLIKPRAELVNLFSAEGVKTSMRRSMDSNVDLIFYDEIKNEDKEQIFKEIDILIGPKIDEVELKLYSNLKMHQTFATGLEEFDFTFYKNNNIIL